MRRAHIAHQRRYQRTIGRADQRQLWLLDPLTLERRQLRRREETPRQRGKPSGSRAICRILRRAIPRASAVGAVDVRQRRHLALTQPGVPFPADRAVVVLIGDDMCDDDINAERLRVSDAPLGDMIETRDRHNRQMFELLRVGHREMRDLHRHLLIMARDTLEEQHQDRHEQDDDPGATIKLRDHNDNRDHAGRQRARQVDRQ